MKTILCYGDSNTYGYRPDNGLRFDESTRWTGRLASLLKRDKGVDDENAENGRAEYRVIEEGCNGRTTIYDDPEDPWKNGLPYLKPCLNTHKPVDIVILMLGSNDLKDCFKVSASDIADGAGVLVETIQTFTEEKQGFVPRIVLVSPPEIGEGITTSPFRDRFTTDAISRSREFPAYYKAMADKYGCVYANAAEWVKASEIDSLHLDAEGHKVLAEKLCEVVRRL